MAVELRSLNQELFEHDRNLWKCFLDILFAFGDLHRAPGIYDRGEIPDAVAQKLHGMSVREMAAFVKRSKQDYYRDLISELEDSVKYNQILLESAAGEDKTEYQRKINLYQEMVSDVIKDRDEALAEYSCLDES